MQFVPSLPPPISPAGPEEALEVNKLAEVKRAKDVLQKPASMPAPIQPERHEPSPEPENPAAIPDRRHAEDEQGERRKFCRRIGQQSILAELRAEADRRRKKQRKDDLSLHIDEEA